MRNAGFAIMTLFLGLMLATGIAFADSVSSCSNLTNDNTVYTLTQNLTGNDSSGYCVEISATNITVDCDGFSINGNSSATTHGIEVISQVNTTIKNCLVFNYSVGIHVNSSNFTNLTNNTAYRNFYGIELYTSYNNTVNNNTAYNNTFYGIVLFWSNNNTLTDNIANNTRLYHGIYLHSSSNTVVNNTANSNKEDGIRLYFSSNSTIANNTVYNNTYNGIYLDTICYYDNITNNTIDSNNDGLYLKQAANTTIVNNTIHNNRANGLYVYNSLDNTIANNTANNNTYDGIHLDSTSQNNTFTDNSAVGNTHADIESDSASVGNVFRGITINTTVFSFTYSGAIDIKGASSPAADPYFYYNISKYLNITNASANAWVLLNMSYTDSDMVGRNEQTAGVFQYNGSWYHHAQMATVYGQDETNNYVYANLTHFSIYAIMSQLNSSGGCVLNSSCDSACGGLGTGYSDDGINCYSDTYCSLSCSGGGGGNNTTGGSYNCTGNPLIDDPRCFEVTIGNASIQVYDVMCYDETNGKSTNVTLNAFDTMDVLCNATVYHEEGCQVFNGTQSGNVLTLKFFDSTQNNTTCTADDSKNCYINTTCKAVGSCTNLLNQTIECTVEPYYNANNTTWTGWINATDIHGTSNYGNDTIPIENLNALNVTNATLNLGTLAPGANTSTHTNGTNIENGGNIKIDLNLNGTSVFTCPTPPDIGIGNLSYDLTTGTAYGSGTALTTAATAKSTFNLDSAAGSSGVPTAPNKYLYWGMGMPMSIVGGQTCSATIRVAAIMDQ